MIEPPRRRRHVETAAGVVVAAPVAAHTTTLRLWCTRPASSSLVAKEEGVRRFSSRSASPFFVVLPRGGHGRTPDRSVRGRTPDLGPSVECDVAHRPPMFHMDQDTRPVHRTT